MGGWGDSIQEKRLAQQFLHSTVSKPMSHMQDSKLVAHSGKTPNVNADVYAVENVKRGVWQAENILDAGYDSDSSYELYTLCIEVDNIPGVLQVGWLL